MMDKKEKEGRFLGKNSIIFGAIAIVGLAAIMVMAGSVYANTISSGTMIFEGALTDNGDGTYSGILPMVDEGAAGIGDSVSGYDVYAKDGATGMYDTAGSGSQSYTSGTIVNHDAYTTAGGWGSYYDPDCADWYNYQLNFTGNHWALEYNGNVGNDGILTGALANPMSGIMNWGSMYALESEAGSYYAGMGTPESPGYALNNPYTGTNDGTAAWDMDWSWGSEYIPLEFPGFDTTVTSLGGGQYRVTLTPSAPSTVWVDDGYGPSTPGWGIDHFASIQDGIDAVSGSTVYVAAGTYDEQLNIDKPVTIIGAGAGSTIITNTTTLTDFFTTSANNYPIVYIHDTDDVIIRNLTVDGAGNGNANYRFEGISFLDAGGILNNLEIKSVRDTPFSGAQHGVAIYAWDNAGTARTIKVENCNIYDYQKNAMALSGADLYAEVRNCTVTGAGPTSVTAQNGIQFYLATGIIDNNTVTGNWYTGTLWGASGNLVLYSDNVVVTNNTLDTDQLAVAYFGSGGVIAHNTFINCGWPIVLYGDAYVYDNTFSNSNYGDKTYMAELVGTHHFWGMIQDAIDNATDGDTVLVYEGEYVENLVVNKDITLTGNVPPTSSVQINGTIDVTADGATIKWFKIVPGSVSGDEAGIAVYASDVTIDSNIIDGMTETGATYTTIKGIHVYGAGSGIDNIILVNNTIQNIDNQAGSPYGGADGIMIQGVVDGVLIDNNTIEDIHSAGWAYGLEITPTGSDPTNPPQNVVVTGNTIEKVNDGSVYNVAADPYAAPYPGVCLGVDEYFDGMTYYPADASQVVAHYNNFVNPVGASNKDSSYDLDATLNYWGDASGPNATSNPDGRGAIVTDYVDFTPWLDDMYPDTDYNNGQESPVDYSNVTDVPSGTSTVDAQGVDTTVVIESSGSNTVTILGYTGNPEGDLPGGATGVGDYIDLSVDDPGAVTYPIYLQINYTAADLTAAGLAEDELLGIAYWNAAAGAWVLYADTGVNTTNFGVYEGYVWANIQSGELSPKVIIGGTYDYPQSHLSVTYDPDGYISSASTFHVWATSSSPWKIFYKIDGVQHEGTWNQGVHFQLNELHGYSSGPHTIEYWAVDPGTYEETHHVETYVLDTSGPSTTMNFQGISEVTATQKYQITTQTMMILDATDIGCGVASIHYRIDDGNWNEYTEPFTIAEEGIHTVYYYALDNLGNTGTMTSKTIQVGGGEPTTICHITPEQPTGNNGWYVSDVTVTLTATDEASGVDHTMYRIDNGEWQTYTGSFVVDGDGIHIIQYRSVDNAGNVENPKETQVKMDFYGPEISVYKPISFLYVFDRAIMPLPGDKPLIIGKITIMSTIEDTATSGVDSAKIYVDNNLRTTFVDGVEYTLDETMFGTHTIKIVAYDMAGNEAVKEIKAGIYNLNIFEKQV